MQCQQLNMRFHQLEMQFHQLVMRFHQLEHCSSVTEVMRSTHWQGRGTEAGQPQSLCLYRTPDVEPVTTLVVISTVTKFPTLDLCVCKCERSHAYVLSYTCGAQISILVLFHFAPLTMLHGEARCFEAVMVFSNGGIYST